MLGLRELRCRCFFRRIACRQYVLSAMRALVSEDGAGGLYLYVVLVAKRVPLDLDLVAPHPWAKVVLVEGQHPVRTFIAFSIIRIAPEDQRHASSAAKANRTHQ